MVNSDLIGNRTLHQRNQRTSNNSHDHDSGAVAGERAKLSHAQGEDAGEHDGVEEADQDDAPHGEVSCGEHRDCYERARGDGANSQQ